MEKGRKRDRNIVLVSLPLPWVCFQLFFFLNPKLYLLYSHYNEWQAEYNCSDREIPCYECGRWRIPPLLSSASKWVIIKLDCLLYWGRTVWGQWKLNQLLSVPSTHTQVTELLSLSHWHIRAFAIMEKHTHCMQKVVGSIPGVSSWKDGWLQGWEVSPIWELESSVGTTGLDKSIVWFNLKWLHICYFVCIPEWVFNILFWWNSQKSKRQQ